MTAAVRRFALMGHSGAGKSSCLLALGIDWRLAEMDNVLGTVRSPLPEIALSFLAGDGVAPSIMVVSNHEQMLLGLRNAKLEGRHPEKFAAVCFVYLRNSKDQLRAQLALPSAWGRNREPACQQYTLDNYDLFDGIYADMADRTVDCLGRGFLEVVAEVRQITLLPDSNQT